MMETVALRSISVGGALIGTWIGSGARAGSILIDFGGVGDLLSGTA